MSETFTLVEHVVKQRRFERHLHTGRVYRTIVLLARGAARLEIDRLE